MTDEVVLLGLEEAGRRLGLTAAMVRYLADQGELHALRDSARRRLFFPSDVEEFRKKRAARKQAGKRKG